MNNLGDPEEWTDYLLATGVAWLPSFVFTEEALSRAASYNETCCLLSEAAEKRAARDNETRRLQSEAAEKARREEAEVLEEYSSMAAIEGLLCAVCQRLGRTRCSRCEAVRYCSSNCRMRHWNGGHKYECPPGQSVPSTSSSRQSVPSTSSSSNGGRDFSDIGSSNDSPGSGSGSRTLSEAPAVVAAPPAESATATPVLNGVGTPGNVQKILFPYDSFVRYFNWAGSKMPPCGLMNCRNSSFVNVVLQCLTHTTPLFAYLLEGTHGAECRRRVSGDWCFMCELEDHTWRVKNPQSPFKILSRIRNIGSLLRNGRQEDAHMFMRFAIDSLQSSCLDKAGRDKSVDPRSEQPTLIDHIFGGHLQSQVTCMKCSHQSHRYENMMDLDVEIQGSVETLEDALAQFTAPEWLHVECDRCNARVEARKRLSLHEAPNVLTISVKRFQSEKLGKRVIFPEFLNLSPYMSGTGDMPPLYRLYAVIVHVGHYICYVKDPQGVWYKIDDSKVTEVDLEKVMAQRAYMLFYTRSCARPDQVVDNVDGSPETQIVPGQPISNGNLAALQPRSRDMGQSCSSSRRTLQRPYEDELWFTAMGLTIPEGFDCHFEAVRSSTINRQPPLFEWWFKDMNLMNPEGFDSVTVKPKDDPFYEPKEVPLPARYQKKPIGRSVRTPGWGRGRGTTSSHRQAAARKIAELRSHRSVLPSAGLMGLMWM